MNVPTITMAHDEASAKAAEYSEAFDRSGNPEDEALAQGFDALATGARLLSLRAVYAYCLADARNRPRLAIARADRRQVHWTGAAFHADRFARGARPKHAIIPVPWRQSHLSSPGYADLPLIPPTVRERRDLAKYFVLWEVQAWRDYESETTPDRDPYLLKRVNRGLDLFTIVAEWQVTDLEAWAAAQR